jgi:predicted transcriptional regulator
MDFKTAAKWGAYFAKDYAEEIFRLLVNYKDISASEAASRLNLHIQTAQDFLEAMTSLDILSKKEVYEKKRPYFRYSLKMKKIVIDIDLASLLEQKQPEGKLSKKIRENKDSGARFTTARYDPYFSSVAIWTGEGRERKERKINLTIPQGKFLFQLPFPTAEFLTVAEIIQKAGVDKIHSPEIIDVVELLEKYGVIKVK